MNVVLATFGTDGDVFPFLGLGRELVQRGHTVSLATCASYRARVLKHGMSFHELLSERESEEVLSNPDFWHPLKAGPLAARWGVRFLRRQYDLLAGLLGEERTVLLANPGVLAARLAHERLGTPFASVILQPWVIPSAHLPPIIPGIPFPRGGPRWLWKIYARGLNLAGDLLLGGPLQSLRKDLGLPRINRVFDWWFSPQLILGMFPAWFGPRQPDWPPQVRVLSFPSFDGAEPLLSPDIERFLANGEPPVAITFGTGIRHAASLYDAASEACARVGRRSIIVTKYSEQIPKPLPPGAFATEFTPFSTLFGRCAAVIHHGGIGTTAKALLARAPQLVVPICFDQLDNATRVERLGGGSWLKFRHATTARISERLEKILQMRVQMQEERGPGPSALAFTRAAEMIEGMG